MDYQMVQKNSIIYIINGILLVLERKQVFQVQVAPGYGMRTCLLVSEMCSMSRDKNKPTGIA